MENRVADNSRELGKLLAACDPGLFRRADGYGLYKIPCEERPRHRRHGQGLRALLMDTVDITVSKNGKFASDMPPAATLDATPTRKAS